MKNSILVIVVLLATLMAFCPKNSYADAPLQVSFINPIQIVNEFEDVKGLRVNFIHGINADVSGIDLGLINRTKGVQKGLQVGFYNSSYDFNGLQIGIINEADWLNGVQIGLINVHKNGERDFFPIVNFSF